MIRISPDRVLIQTACHQCFVEVEHGPHGHGWVTISLLSGHVPYDHRSLRHRLGAAWEALGGSPGELVELMNPDEVDNLIQALQEARVAAFGPQIVHQRPAKLRMVLMHLKHTVSLARGLIGWWPRKRQTSPASSQISGEPR